MNKKLLATGGLVTTLVLLGSASSTYAKTGLANAPVGLHRSFKAVSDAQVGKIAAKLGLKEDEVRQDLADGKLLPEILKENGIDVSQLRSAWNHKAFEKIIHRKIHKAFGNDPHFIEAEAKALDLSVSELKSKLQTKRLFQILKEENITEVEFRRGLASALKDMIDDGDITGERAERYQKFIDRIKANR